MQGYLSLIIAVLGLVVYMVSTNAKTAECGRIAYFAGLLAFLILLGSRSISLLH